jgi:hypothetical protein
MNVYEIDPTNDERWEPFLEGHSQASIFHTRGWVEALRGTYGYTTTAFTTCPPEAPLTNAIPFCKVPGFFGKRRAVSLPFSDHCVPLVEGQKQLEAQLLYLRNRVDSGQWSSFQIKTIEEVSNCSSEQSSDALTLHNLDLRPSLDELFAAFHPSCVQRKIKRAERESLRQQEGRSEDLVNAFYGLLLHTRRRLGVPPQPYQWFRNLVLYLGDKLKVRIIYKDELPVAGIVTLHYKQTTMYKYGASDHRYSALGGMQSLFWAAIKDAKENGDQVLDMGRTELTNTGLTAFKDRLGAARTAIHYYQYPPRSTKHGMQASKSRILKTFCSHAPMGLLAATGRVLYKYAG